MKKLTYGFLVLLCVVFMTGCGSDDSSSYKIEKCTNKMSTNNMEYTANYELRLKDDTHVKSVKTTETIKSSDSDYLTTTKESIEELYDNVNNQYGGYSCSVKISGDTLTSECVIDYEKMDLKQYIQDNPSAKVIADDDYKATSEGLKSTYKALGAKCE